MKKQYIFLATAFLMTFAYVISAKAEPSNLALNKSVTTSSGNGSLAVDGNDQTRWESAFEDPQWIYVDLEDQYHIAEVIINWEAASAKVYEVEVSDDATDGSWTSIYSETNNPGAGIRDMIVNGTGRYIRIYGTERNLTYGYSIFELEIYGVAANETRTLSRIDLTAEKTIIKTNTPVQLQAMGYDQFDLKMLVDPVWSSNGGSVSEEGIFSATTPGTYTITATSESISGTISIEVQGDPVLSRLVISPDDTQTTLGNDVTFTASGYDQFGDEIAAEIAWSSDNNGSIGQTTGLFTADKVGTFTITATSGTVTESTTLTVKAVNIAINKTAVASNEVQSASLAVDGDNGTRWETEHSAPQWIYIDLEDMYLLNFMEIIWEGASAADYTIDISSDATNWQTVYSVSDITETARTDAFEFFANARYVRMMATERTTPWGISIYEWIVNGEIPQVAKTLNSISVSTDITTLEAGEQVQLSAFGYDSDLTPYPIAPVWSVDNSGDISTEGLFTATSAGTYRVTVQDGSISGYIDMTVNGTSTSLDKQSASIKVSGQNSIICVDNLNPEKHQKIEVYSSNGQLLKSQLVKNSQTQISGFNKGLVIIKISGKENFTRKISIQ
ncbi:galactose-binding domain-containing protein [Carboxylicivirga caseinilyticus]|uniref:galactose-binding domain-containing protein n=1 Tax=Carboxylicivirga caseinilyticus TaxID=3417572 RepID=UPI003D32ECC5|nr:discoidin domain-containing protein [Marinilabiliaceae bacterium A049]